MRKNVLNYVLFAVLSAVMIGTYFYAEKNWLPKPEPKPAETKESTPAGDGLAAAAGVAGSTAQPVKPEVKPEVKPAAPPTPAEPPTLIALGEEGFFNRVMLSTRGGGVQQIVLPEFYEATRLGKEAKGKDGKPLPLYLVPGNVRIRPYYLEFDAPYPDLQPGKANVAENLAEPSYTMFHYASPVSHKDEDYYPLPDLGERTWEVEKELHPHGGTHEVVFKTTLGEPYFLTIRKTYTLDAKDYHFGLRIEIKKDAVPGAAKDKGLFRYQLAGPHGLPIEGEWYTSTYRNAMTGSIDPRGTWIRTFEDSATIGNKRGGEQTGKGNNTIEYAAIATQYFASALAVDDRIPVKERGWLAYVRATTEAPTPEEFKRAVELTILDPTNAAARERAEGFKRAMELKQPQFDDITFRAVTEPINLAPGESVTHSYLIYNGPAKVKLLKLLSGEKTVDEGLVDRYLDGLGLKTITDYQSPSAIGRFANFIYWTDVVLFFTNLMHYLLSVIHGVLAFIGLGSVSWGLSIVVLTVMVRLLLFFPSRKQTAMNMKMVEVQTRLKPDIDKLHEKYKDDFQTYNREKTALLMKNGVNPFAAMGGCLLLFAQMPVFMGLYFCLQESIFFRLEPLLWIKNLAAPDMTVWWSEHIPVISTPDSLGGFLYLGPYLNVLPILAVGLMMWQQTKMMPPPTDEMAQQQRMMMKIMLGMMALFFYKVAAGLSIYFIVTTCWGIVERQLIPKPKIKASELAHIGDPNAPPRPKGWLGRKREEIQKKLEELQKQAEAQSSRQARNDNKGRDNDRKKKRRR